MDNIQRADTTLPIELMKSDSASDQSNTPLNSPGSASPNPSSNNPSPKSSRKSGSHKAGGKKRTSGSLKDKDKDKKDKDKDKHLSVK